jgi:hypothetical protein
MCALLLIAKKNPFLPHDLHELQDGAVSRRASMADYS